MKYILLIISSIVILSACDIKKKENASDAPPVQEQSIEKFTVTETKEGKPHWVLDADSAQIIESQKKALLQAPKIKFFKEGKYVSTLVADRGRINTENYDIWGDGKCLLTTTEGERLETSNLHYRSDIQKIVTDDRVKLIRSSETITGTGMEATPDLQNMTIKKNRVEVK